MARYDDTTRGLIKAAIAFVRGRVAEEHTCRGTWCKLMENVGRKVRIVEASENTKIGQIRRLSIKPRKRDLVRDSRAQAVI
jgi:hypothetical protein